MISEALLHCQGVGPVRLAQLHQREIRTWTDVLDNLDQVPAHLCTTLETECRRCLRALDEQEIQYFVNRFTSRDRWRILAEFLDQASFFDIETTGLEHDDSITVIACWHKAKIHTFVEGDNLDDFLDLLDEMSLLVSFNGSSFDVPRVLDAFHIPTLPCAHLDLRWTCFHQGYIGGLKEIANLSGLTRPSDLQNCDGGQAVRLWQDWKSAGNTVALARLIRYCAADVVLLGMLAHRLVDRNDFAPEYWWNQLPSTSNESTSKTVISPTCTAGSKSFGLGNLERIRARRLRTAS